MDFKEITAQSRQAVEEILEAAKVLKSTSALPAVCGRVCPQEKQWETR